MISIRVLKTCGKSIIELFLIIYKIFHEKGCFRNKWKKANVVLVHKNDSYQKTIDQDLWRGYSITQCFNFSSKITSSLIVRRVLKQMNCASTNLFPLLTKYVNHLMMTTEYGMYFLIYRNHLTNYGTKVFTKH